MDNKRNGMEPLSEEQLEAASGGVSAYELLLKRAELAARADGRRVGLANDHLSSGFCPCDYRYKWAKIDRAINSDNRTTRGYSDIKCYKCGKENKGSIY